MYPEQIYFSRITSHHQIFKKWSPHISHKKVPAFFESELVSYDIENFSRQKYHEMWPLKVLSNLLTAVNQYNTIVWKLLGLQRNFFNNGTTLNKTFSIKTVYLNTTSECIRSTNVCFDDIVHGAVEIFHLQRNKSFCTSS